MVDKTEEMLAGWDIDRKYKYLCFYHKGFPFMRDSWGMDCSDFKQELLDAEWGLFSPRDISEHSQFDETFRLVLNAIASDPQLLLCSDGEYRICRYAGSGWNWVGTSVRFTKTLWKTLSSQYRRDRKNGCRMHRMHLIALDDAQFEIAQRLIYEVFGDTIDAHETKDEF
ncbi:MULTISPECIES: hypothetical protein [unclassified Microcoleus]|uniref:hypothetical protein n=1 Tax=unclassified Microcoleus TaxID=2642155 RepID=UPI002FD03425